MKFTSRARLYAELGWETIAKRIKSVSISNLHKIHPKQTRCLIGNYMPIISDTNYSSRRGKLFYLNNSKNRYFGNTYFLKTVSCCKKKV